MNIYKLLFGLIIIFSISCNKDLCEDKNCLNGSICNTETGNCDCVNGYTGTFCQTAPDLCENVSCLNGGNCNSATGDCDCVDGYTGEFCQNAPDLCANISCQNDGTCDSATGECVCINGYTGEFCEIAPDLCENVECQNDGTCDSATGECQCINGYTGEFCEIPPVAPTASFTSVTDMTNLTEVAFTNTSTDATDYAWDFGDGYTSLDENPVHTYAAFGTYTVTMTASNAYLSDIATADITLMDTTMTSNDLPVISEAGFEDYSDIFGCEDGQTFGYPGNDDGRDCWRNDAGGVVQITQSPVFAGDQAGKLPAAGDRVGMQQITVEPNTDYNLSFWYTMKVDPGTFTVAILDDFVTDVADVANATIADISLTDNSDPNTYVNEVLSFNSGNNTAITIYFGNSGVECRIDNFEFIY